MIRHGVVMWGDLIRSVDATATFREPAAEIALRECGGPAATFGDPVDEAALRACEVALGHPLSADLTALLRETDGVSTAYDDSSLWTLSRIHEENTWILT